MRTFFETSVTKTAPGNGPSISIISSLGPYSPVGEVFTIRVRIEALTAGPAVFSLFDSVDGFVSDVQLVKTFSVSGPIGATADQTVSWQRSDVQSLRAGIAGAAMRLSLISLPAGGSVTYSWFGEAN